jgi:hypothetical protein
LYYKELQEPCFVDIARKLPPTDFSDSLNEAVYASPPIGGSGFRVAGSFRYAPLPRLTPFTFCLLWSLLRKPLFGPPNRRKQPEGYAPFCLKLFLKWIDKIIEKYYYGKNAGGCIWL